MHVTPDSVVMLAGAPITLHKLNEHGITRGDAAVMGFAPSQSEDPPSGQVSRSSSGPTSIAYSIGRICSDEVVAL